MQLVLREKKRLKGTFMEVVALKQEKIRLESYYCCL